MLEVTNHVSHSKEYNLKNVRALLSDTFTAPQLQHLLEVSPEFKRASAQLVQNADLAQIVQELLTYAERQVKVEALLALVKDHNPVNYEAHRPYYTSVSVSATVMAKGSDQELKDLHHRVSQPPLRQKILEGLASFVQSLNIAEGLNHKTEQKFELVELISKEKRADLYFSVTVTGAEGLLQEFGGQFVEETWRQSASDSLEPLGRALQEAEKTSSFFPRLGLPKLFRSN